MFECFVALFGILLIERFVALLDGIYLHCVFVDKADIWTREERRGEKER